ncbi:glycosyltransferase family 4 protein [Sphingomonas sp. XXL09]|uniref:glycosyltransferase family 4 protein n=1 Tax=Sphingomonas sp. XXL09 TaxID=3457787 RepID=UPI00406BC88D
MLAVADHCARAGDSVTVMGAGQARPGTPYTFEHVPAINRERFERLPTMPLLRADTAYEEASFAPGLALRYRPGDYDVTVTCSYPFTNWILRRPRLGGQRPAHVFVTQNSDWPAITRGSEYRWFGCEGLVCTNPDFYERNQERWNCALIPNGIDLARFSPGVSERARLGLPQDKPIVLMVSAFIESKRVLDGIRAVAAVPHAHLVVAGDGALRDAVDALAAELLPGRFSRLTVTPADMPALYRSADAFLHMSLLESFGNVFVEALACGLPIIGHDTPRLRWIVGDDELLVDTQSLSAVSQAISVALTATTDRKAVRLERSRRFGWDAIGTKYRDFFRSLSR